MRIIYVHQFFKTPEEGGGLRSWYLAKKLIDAGHDVQLISSHNKLSGSKTIDGIRVHYCRIPYNNSFGFIRRLWVYGLFVLKARKLTKRLAPADLAYVMTTPLTTGFIATWIKRRLNIPYIFEVGDLWPDVPIGMKVIRNPILKSWLYSKEKQFYGQAVKIIALSTDIAGNIERKTSTPVFTITNLADRSYFEFHKREEAISSEFPLKVLYCGAHGRANHLEFVLKAAKLTSHLPVVYRLMGDGSEKERLQKLAKEIPNVMFLQHTGRNHVKKEIESCDAMFVSFDDVPMLHTGSPNKFFDALAAGKLVISNLGGWTSRVIAEEGIGFSYDPAFPEELVPKLEYYLELENLRRAQQLSRDLASKYDRDKQSDEWLRIITN